MQHTQTTQTVPMDDDQQNGLGTTWKKFNSLTTKFIQMGAVHTHLVQKMVHSAKWFG